MSNIGNVQPLKFWCQKVLPLVYDESLSYYELLCKVVAYLNALVVDVKEISDIINGSDFQEMVDQAVSEILTESKIYEEFQDFIEEVASDDSSLHNLIAGNSPISTAYAIEDVIAISSESHIAFPSVEIVSGTPHIYYRSGTAHASYDGVIKHETVNFDTREVTTVATYSLSGWDLRDLHVANGGSHIYCMARSTTLGNKTVVIDTSNGNISDVTFDGDSYYMIGGGVYKYDNLNYFVGYNNSNAYLMKQASAGSNTVFNIIKDFGSGYNEGSVCPSGNGFLIVLRAHGIGAPGKALFATTLNGDYEEYALPFNPEGPELFRAAGCTFLSYRCRNKDKNQDYSAAELVIQSMNGAFIGSTKYKYLRNAAWDCGYTDFAADSAYLYIAFYVAESNRVYIAKMRLNNLLQDAPTLVINKSNSITAGLHTYSIPVHGNISPIADASVVCGNGNIITSIRSIAQSSIGVNAYNITDNAITATISVRTSNVNTNLIPATWVTMAG